MKTPKISIIVPVYDSEKYLCACIDSILTQTIQDFELILVDDGSRDNSGAFCDAYANNDKRIKVFHVKNGGASAARNLGLLEAKGEYVSFIDSDDLLEPTFYENFFIDKNYSYDIYFQNYVRHEADGKIEYKSLNQMLIKDGNIESALLYLMKEVKFGWSWIKLFKRMILIDNNIRFDINIKLREDELLTLQYCKYISSISISSKAGYHYYVYNSSLTRRFRDPSEFVRISCLLRDELSYYSSADIQNYSNQYYLSNLFFAVMQIYMNGKIPIMTKDKRYSIIDEFLNYYYSHKELKLHYKTKKAKLMYNVLWNIRSKHLIDFVFQMWFNVKY